MERECCWKRKLWLTAVITGIPFAVGVFASACGGSGGAPPPGSGGASGAPGNGGSGSTATGGTNTGGAGLGGTGGSSGGCSASCDDGFDCTVDSCLNSKCTHSIGPNSGATACPAGQYCTVEKGCVANPACATDEQCVESFKGDACKTNIKCDPKSSLCLFDTLDKDGDKHPAPACGGDDCDDSAVTIHPGVTEMCNGKDDDCSGTVDPKPSVDQWCQASKGAGYSCENGSCVCSAGLMACPDACADPKTDSKNCGKCGLACADGETCQSGACKCSPGAKRSCFPPNSTTPGMESCAQDGTWDGCCNIGKEICNGKDDDCDGLADNGFACIADLVVTCQSTCGAWPGPSPSAALCSSTCELPASCPGSDVFPSEMSGGSVCGGQCCNDGCPMCKDGWDNDCDGLIDCDDPDCRGEQVASPNCCGVAGLPCCAKGGTPFCLDSAVCQGSTCQ